MRVATFSAVLLAASLALACSVAVDAKRYKYAELEKWVVGNGGMVKTVIRKNRDGYRGLFSKVAARAGENLATITGASMINAGSITGAFLTPTLTVLREIMHPDSRVKPYLKVMPGRNEVLNACNLPDKYLPLLQSEYWTGFVRSWQDYLAAALAGERNADMEWTIPEALGNVTLTLDDLKYGCAISATRYVATNKRNRLMMIPIYDMANHVRDCPHYISVYDDVDHVHIVAGSDVVAGDEICYSYGYSMRDDYAVMHYGFVPALEDPPRLLVVDHHQFDPASHTQDLTEELFPGHTQDDVARELARQQKTLGELEALDAAKKDGEEPAPAPGTDYIHDTLMTLQWRRRNALRHEISRLQAMLSGHTQTQSSTSGASDRSEL